MKTHSEFLASIAPKKGFGQNFLTNQHYLAKIASECVETATEMIEIGPGKGGLTKAVLELNNQDKLFAIEIDVRMSQELDKIKSDFQNFDYQIKDFLHSGAEVEDKIIFGNLPYGVASRIILSIIDKKAKKLVFLVQKEVAERITAKASTREYGSLSIIIQAYYTVKRGLVIPPGAFFPAPKVNSQLIILKRKDQVDFFDHGYLLRLLSLSFQFKRKKIRNNLYQSWKECEKYIDIDKRPEDITVEQYIQMAQKIIF